MGIIIQSGRGSGKSAGVTKKGLLTTYSVVAEDSSEANRCGYAFNAVLPSQSPATTACFFHLANTSTGSSPADFHVFSIELNLTGARDYVNVYMGQNTTLAGGTLATPCNMNIGNDVSPPIAYNYGANITGFDTAAKLCGIINIEVSNGSKIWSPECHIIIPPGRCIFMCGTSGPVIFGNVMFFFPDTDTKFVNL